MKVLDKATIHKALAGKAIERGLTPEEDGAMLRIEYDQPTTPREDHLHKQAIRNLAGRLDEEGRVHITSIKGGNGGFMVEVTPSSMLNAPAASPQTENLLSELIELLREKVA